MTLPQVPKKEPKVIQVSFRISKRAADELRTLAKAHNLSQADVVEYLIKDEFKRFETKREK